ncbi:unnamed protein product [Protopolystoma xenopodis]|uniref:Uncharacterized protein n=1 Tax=Protopolystoma xenopodis TaxID=117903 RepID=A0A448WCP1_9PLAT|nr:unnamed protein product [Protopolystoma xenopodis]
MSFSPKWRCLLLFAWYGGKPKTPDYPSVLASLTVVLTVFSGLADHSRKWGWQEGGRPESPGVVVSCQIDEFDTFIWTLQTAFSLLAYGHRSKSQRTVVIARNRVT